MTPETPTWSATRKSIVEDARVAMEDLGYGAQKAAEVVVSDSDFVVPVDEADMIDEVYEELTV